MMKKLVKEEGAVVGLPLYILITVVVAAVALAAVLSFMVTSGPSINSWQIYISNGSSGSFNLTKVIKAHTDTTGEAKWSGQVKIVIEDQNGHPLPNVKVVLDGCGVTEAGQTDSNGTAVITLNDVTLPSGVQQDQIQVKMQYPGLIGEQTKTDTITVIRG